MGARSGRIQAAAGVDAKIVPENRTLQYWAPDIIKLGDRYLLYYSFRRLENDFGHRSCNHTTLDPGRSAYHWTDRGFVVRTQDGDGYNAI